MPQKPLNSAIGLCLRCRHSTTIKSARDTVFYLCELSKTDPRFPKYPRLPVLACGGFEERESKDSNQQPQS